MLEVTSKVTPKTTPKSACDTPPNKPYFKEGVSEDSMESMNKYFVNTTAEWSDSYKNELTFTVEQLSKWLKTSKTPGPTMNSTELAEKVAQLSPIDKAGKTLGSILKESLPLLVEQSVRVDHPHCSAHLHCPTLIPALAAEVILSTLNQSMDSWDQAPVATHIEKEVIDWLCEYIYPKKNAGGSFTSGGTQSNLTALFLARDYAISNKTFNINADGLPQDFNRYKVICSKEAHFSIAKSCAILGLGFNSVISIESDEKGDLVIPDLQKKVDDLTENKEKVLAIIGTAGTTDLGAIDPLNEMADIAEKIGCWFHVDAAYGGALAFSQYKNRLTGIDKAHSVTIDFHKMFFQPISCSALLVKNKEHMTPLCFHADYLSREEDEEPNLVDHSLSTTRRFDSLKVWLSFQTLGLDNFARLIHQLIDLTKYAAEQINSSPKLSLCRQPELTSLVFRFVPTSWQSDAFHQSVRRYLLQNGLAVIAETRIDSQVCLKLTLLNPCVTPNDISELLNKIINAAMHLEKKNMNANKTQQTCNQAL